MARPRHGTQPTSDCQLAAAHRPTQKPVGRLDPGAPAASGSRPFRAGRGVVSETMAISERVWYLRGMAETVTRSQLERRAALARLEVEEMSADLAAAAAATADVAELAAAISRSLEALRTALDLPFGLRVEQAAARLEVSKPTIKKWIGEGLLEAVPDRAPAEVTQESVVRVERILWFVRENFPARTWAQQLAAYLHDRDLQQQEWFRAGLERKRGEYVEL